MLPFFIYSSQFLRDETVIKYVNINSNTVIIFTVSSQILYSQRLSWRESYTAHLICIVCEHPQTSWKVKVSALNSNTLVSFQMLWAQNPWLSLNCLTEHLLIIFHTTQYQQPSFILTQDTRQQSVLHCQQLDIMSRSPASSAARGCSHNEAPILHSGYLTFLSINIAEHHIEKQHCWIVQLYINPLPFTTTPYTPWPQYSLHSCW